MRQIFVDFYVDFYSKYFGNDDVTRATFTIIRNFAYIFVLPFIVGLVIRLLVRRCRRAYLVTAVFAVLTLIGWSFAAANPIPGSELFGLLAVQITCAFTASFLTGLVLRLKEKVPVSRQQIQRIKRNIPNNRKAEVSSSAFVVLYRF